MYFVTSDEGKPSLIFSFFVFQTERNELSSFLRFLKYGKVKLVVKKSEKQNHSCYITTISKLFVIIIDIGTEIGVHL